MFQVDLSIGSVSQIPGSTQMFQDGIAKWKDFTISANTLIQQGR